MGEKARTHAEAPGQRGSEWVHFQMRYSEERMEVGCARTVYHIDMISSRQHKILSSSDIHPFDHRYTSLPPCSLRASCSAQFVEIRENGHVINMGALREVALPSAFVLNVIK